MAKISIEFDTNEKSLSVSLDGQKLDNISSVCFDPSWDDNSKFNMSIITRSEDEATDIETCQILRASQIEFNKEKNITEKLSDRLLKR